MSVVGRFTTRSLKKNLVRTIVTVLGVALSALLVTAVLSTYASLNRFLYDMEVAESGHWEAYAELADGSQVAKARDDGALAQAGVELLATLSDIGFCDYADLGEFNGNNDMSYLALKSFTGDMDNALGVRCSQGRLPENDGELLVPYNILDENTGYDNGFALGETVELPVGQRQAPDGAPGAEGYLNSSQGFFTTEDMDGLETARETLVDKQVRRYTVVGAYSRWNQAVVTGAGWTAFTAAEPQPGSFTEAYVAASDARTSNEVKDAVEQAFPEAESVQLHNGLLRARGVTSESALWESFGAIVVILAVVVIAACVSLIYNAFNISVVQRMRQFGLLASIGATKRQLRRSVLLEGAIIAGIGVPLGILAGLGATAAALAWANPLFMESLVGDLPSGESYLDGLALGLHVDAGIIAFAAALTVLTVFVSLFVPMLRAGKASPIEAIRETRSVRIGRRGQRKAAAAARNKRAIWAPRGLGGRIGGVGGTIAAINRSREKSKGRTASVALAVAVTLMMTAGQLDVTLSTLTRTASTIPYDFSVYAFVYGVEDDEEGAEGETDASDAGTSASDFASAPASASGDDDSSAAADEAFGESEMLAAYQELYRALTAVEGIRPRGWQTIMSTAAIVPESIGGNANDLTKTQLPDGDYMPIISLHLMDDTLFAELCDVAGVDFQSILESDTPKGIGAGTSFVRDPVTGVFTEQNLFASTGTVQVISSSSYKGKPLTSFFFEYDDDGHVTVCGSTELDGKSDPESVPLAQADNQLVAVDVVALADWDAFLGDSYEMVIAVPLSKAAEWGLGGRAMNTASFNSVFDCDHTQMIEVEGHIYEAVSDFSREFTKAHPGASIHTGVSNLYASQQSMTNLVSIVRLFSLLFSVILVLIAMANVFNTLTNSLALRRREFAVMQSIGMGKRAFRTMIASECVAYGAWGLIFGVVASLAVGWALTTALSSSIQNAAFTVPWGYLGLSLLMVVVAMVLSVAWGLHLCRSRNIVEALRME